MTDRLTDAELDETLHRAGQRWRERNSDPARVDVSAARRRGDAEQPAAGDELPLVSGLLGTAPSGRRTARLWVAAAAAAMVVAGLAVGVVQLTGGGGGNHRVASGPQETEGTTSGDLASALTGTDWTLVAMTSAGGRAISLAVPADLHFEGGSVVFDNGCNSGSGPATVDDSAIRLGEIAQTANACVSTATLDAQRDLIDKVLTGTVGWSIHNATLTVTKSGVGSLSYASTPGPAGGTAGGTGAPAVQEGDAPIDPEQIMGQTWVLKFWVPDATGVSTVPAYPAPPGARIAWAGGLTGFDGCNSFRADYRYLGNRLTITDFDVPDPKPCPSSSTWTEVLRHATTWGFSEGKLTITDDDHGTLTFSAPNR